MWDDDLQHDEGKNDDEDHHLKLFLFAGFWLLTFLLARTCRVLSDNSLTNIFLLFLPLLLPLLLSWAWPRLINFISSIPASLFYGTGLPDLSYENRSYQNDMDKAKKLVREEKWNEAITAYREIIQKTPKKCEPRFNLARIYERVGHLGLALSEYRKIADSENEPDPNRALISEAKRAIEELKKRLSVKSDTVEE